MILISALYVAVRDHLQFCLLITYPVTNQLTKESSPASEKETGREWSPWGILTSIFRKEDSQTMIADVRKTPEVKDSDKHDWAVQWVSFIFVVYVASLYYTETWWVQM